MPEDAYSLYLIRCADDTLYTGIAIDVPRRLAEHRSGPRGAKYLRGRGPFTLAFAEIVGDRSVASRYEQRVKRLSRRQKERLIAGQVSLHDVLAR